MYAVIGLGQSGYASVKFLQQRGYDAAVYDTRAQPPFLSALQQTFPQVPIYLEQWPIEQLLMAQQIVLSPGLPLTLPAIAECRARDIPVVGDIELFAKYCTKPIIAVTGSNGKSTVVTLVGDMIRAANQQVIVAGNIGQPVLECLLADHQQPDYYVLECSSFQLETTYSLRARCACILNISPDHLDRYASFADYVAAKQRIYHHAQAMVINRDDVNTQVAVSTPVLSFGQHAQGAQQFSLMQHNGQSYLAWDQQPWCATADLKIAGQHNWQNALAALAIGKTIGLDQMAMIKALREFGGLPHRCQWVAQHRQVHWYNDSKGTNVGATYAAILGLQAAKPLRSIILILGGRGKGADFSPLVPIVSEHAKHVILLGEAAPQLLALLRHQVPITCVRSLEEAVLFADRLAVANDTVLLSPACASFDMFTDYQARGTAFMEYVHQLTTSSTVAPVVYQER